jgi:3-methyladenine DNA glycosylase/8-oxoguanine DNA glycosylase
MGTAAMGTGRTPRHTNLIEAFVQNTSFRLRQHPGPRPGCCCLYPRRDPVGPTYACSVPSRRITIESRPLDLARSLFPMVRGDGDPTMRVRTGEGWRAARSPDGPTTLHLVSRGDADVEVEAWGPGANWALETAPDLIGAQDNAEGFTPHHPAVADAWKRRPGVRITRNLDVMRTLIATILEQKVTGIEARRAWRRLVRRNPEPAPGPGELLLPPDPADVADLPYFSFHPFGVERRRAEVVRSTCARSSQIDALSGWEPVEARAWLEKLPGIGPWTAAEVARISFGDADAVSIGDFHAPHTVCWALAGEPRGSDERMLELLEPYRGHRGRVEVLLSASGVSAPAYGPKREAVAIERW